MQVKYSPALVHLDHYIATPDEFPANVQLGDGRPLTERLHPLTYLVVGKHVDRAKVDPVRLQDLTCRIREAALGEELRARHEEEDRIVVHERLDSLVRRTAARRGVGVRVIVVGGGHSAGGRTPDAAGGGDGGTAIASMHRA